MAKKTKPVSIRFNEIHLGFLLQKWSIEKPQELVDEIFREVYSQYNKPIIKTKIAPNQIEANIENAPTKTNVENNTTGANIEDVATNTPKTPTMSDYARKQKEDRIRVLKQEIASPPAKLLISKKSYISIREKELETLLKELKADNNDKP